MKVQKWDAPDDIVDNWQSVDIEVYKTILERSEIKHNELISESEEITKRSIQLLTIFFSILILLLGSSYKQQPNQIMIALIATLSIIDLLLFYCIFIGIGLVLKGSEPQLMLRAKLLDYQGENQLKRLYYEEVVRIQRSINTNRIAIEKRRKNYYSAIAASLIVFTLASIVIFNYVSTIFHL